MEGRPKTSPAFRILVNSLVVLGLLAVAPNETCAQSCTAPDLRLPPVTANVGNGPRGIAVLDISLGGSLDLVTADALSGTITFAYGDGMGGFAGVSTPPVIVGAQPWAVAVSDFNRDGVPDVAVANLGGNTLQALLGDGVGGVQLALPPPVGVNPGPSSLVAGDFNRDGIPDLVSANNSGSVQLVTGLGNGTFVALGPGLLLMPGSPQAIVAGDFNRDGRLDIAVADPGAGPPAVIVALGNGAGGWLGLTPFPVPLGQPSSLAAGDLDLDGDLDLVVGDAASGGLVPLLGDGGGGFVAQPGFFSPLPVITSVLLADLDSDGRLDLATAGLGSGAVAVALGDGAGGFLGFTPFPVAEDPFALAAGDFDEDGRPDLVGSGQPVNQAVLLLNELGRPCPNASFAGAGRLQVPIGGGNPRGIARGQWDGDSIPDLALVSNSTLSIMMGDGMLRFGAPTNLPLPATGPPNDRRAVVVADFDLNSAPDLATHNPATNNVSVFLNGGGTFGPRSDISVGSTPRGVVAGDFNGDGAPDLVTVDAGGPSLTFLPGQGDGTFGAPTTTPVGVGGLSALAAADVDGDFVLDVAFTSESGDLVQVWKGNGAGGFILHDSRAVGNFPVAVALRDLNGDLLPDLVVVNALSDDVAVLRNQGGGTFDPAIFFSVGDEPRSVWIGRADGDAAPDIVVANLGTDDVSVLFGDGSGLFPTSTNVLGYQNPETALLVDADRNGKPDLAVPNRSFSGGLVVVPGEGLGGFGPIQTSPGTDNRTLASGDFDRDGKPDLVTVDETSGNFDFLKGQGDGTFAVPVPFPTGLPTPRGAGVGDFDRNGTLDLLIGDWNTSNVMFFAGDGAGGFAGPSLVPSGGNDTSRHHIAAADFDRDGSLDFVKVNGSPGSVTIHFGNGAGGFVSPTTINIGADLTDIAVLDFNRDGIPDIAVSDIVTDELHLLEGRGVRATPFTVRPNLPTGNAATGLAAGDFDRDGITDLVVGHSDEVPPTVGFFRGNATAPAFFNPRQDYGLGDTVAIQASGVAAADVNADGHLDTLVACRGGTAEDRSSVRVLLGTGNPTPGSAFLAADVWTIAQRTPSVIAVEDFDRDGRPDFVTGAFITVSNRISVVLNSNCRARRLRPTGNVSWCNASLTPFGSQPAIQVEDDGANPILCEDFGAPVSVGIIPGTGTGGALLSGDNPLATTGGVADWSAAANPLSIDLAGVKYRLEFTHPLAGRTYSRTFSVSPTLAITGPATYCAASSGFFSTDLGFDTYRWYVDATGPASFAPDLTIGPGALAVGPHTVQVDSTVDTCPASANQPFDVFGDLSSVSIAPAGPYTVCTSCTGPPLTVSETGGGTLTRQWGYRTVSLGAVTPMPSRTGPIYDINGTDFPGIGTYYVVETTTPACGSPLVSSNEVEVAITASPPGDDVVYFTITSRDTENVLEWVNPPGFDTVRIRYNVGPNCAFPTDPVSSGTFLVDKTDLDGPGGRDRFAHQSLPNDTSYCYTVFVDTGAGTYSAGRSNRGRTTTTSGAVKWAFNTGVFSLTAPTVGAAGVIAFSNDYVLHATERGTLGGEWPAQWLPQPLSAPVQSRSPVVPITVGASNPVVYLTAQDGTVYSVDGVRGGSVVFPWAPTPLGGLAGQAAPAGIFTAFGGAYDYLLVGTREGGADNRFYALDPQVGGTIGSFDNGGPGNGIGIISAMASVDYANRLVYFASHANAAGSAETLWCLNLLGSPPPAFSPKWTRPLGDIDSSPVVSRGRVLVGSPMSSGTLHSIEAVDGNPAFDYTFVHGDGQVKSFVFPDWRTGDLYFATDNYVWALHDDGSSIANKFPILPLPGGISLGGGVLPTSAVVFIPGSHYFYVGGSDGKLYEIDVSAGPAPVIKSVTLGDGLATVGAPSLDWQNSFVHVGTEAGVFYAVEVPLP